MHRAFGFGLASLLMVGGIGLIGSNFISEPGTAVNKSSSSATIYQESPYVDFETEVPPTVVEEPQVPEYAWTTRVDNAGQQRAVDKCFGGVTEWVWDNDVTIKPDQPYLPIHRNCGGYPILDLVDKDLVKITGDDYAGDYAVVGIKEISKSSDSGALTGLPGDLLIQTCYPDSDIMKVVSLDKI